MENVLSLRCDIGDDRTDEGGCRGLDWRAGGGCEVGEENEEGEGEGAEEV